MALVLMAFFHYRFVLFFYYGASLSVVDDWLGNLARFLFLFMFGLNFRFYEYKPTAYFVKRIMKLILAASLVSLATFIVVPDYYVVFGVLHFFILCTLILKILPKFFHVLLFASSIFVWGFGNIQTTHNWFLPLGFSSADFNSIDYFPILPFFGYVYVGYMAYDFILDKLPKLKKNTVISIIASHSMMFYLLHVPVILGCLYMLK